MLQIKIFSYNTAVLRKVANLSIHNSRHIHVIPDPFLSSIQIVVAEETNGESFHYVSSLK
jgi:hypothetical protein